mgnify:CR=1 FL=1
MVISRQWLWMIIFSLLVLKGVTQSFPTYRLQRIVHPGDTVVLDTLSLVPGTLQFTVFPAGDTALVPAVNFSKHLLLFDKKKPDSLLIRYRCFAYDFDKKRYHKDQQLLYNDYTRPENPFTIRYNTAVKDNLFLNDGLTKNGNISRGISFGNTQDVVVNSNLNLQVSGKLSPEINMVMAATDNNIPFQADGTTAQLQEFDKVYIQLNNTSTKLLVGDYQLSRPQNSYFMNFYKRAQGLYLENSYTDSSSKKPVTFKTQISGAVSRGKFSRQVFFGVESNQGPYRLRGAANEPFIIVLSGTEKIYIDGRLLERGQENDYIIDYNTGEITFTARQIITKDKRIVAEFQYAERNYARSLFLFGEEINSEKSKFYLNVFSEQDNKNRPLQQSLSQDQKNVLFAIGDTLDKAVYTGVELANFNNSDVFYEKKDTLVNDVLYPGIYVYSIDPEKAKYRIRFSNVGSGKGNYNQVSSAANGKLYVWVAPVNGVPAGSYEPVIPLVTPKQNQMVVAGVVYTLSNQNQLSVEGVYTKNDINTFSTLNKRNDEGSGVKVSSRNEQVLTTDSLKRPTLLTYNVNYEFVQQRFTQVERFRSIEFDRDWNRALTGLILNDQHIGSSEIGLSKAGTGQLKYVYQLFREGETYNGNKHNWLVQLDKRTFKTAYNGSFLTSGDVLNNQNTVFYRHKSQISKTIRRVKFGYWDDFENNRFVNRNSGDLMARAYQFWEWEGSVSNADSSKTSVKWFYRERRDKLAYGTSLKDSTFATNIGVKATVYSIKNHPFTILSTYRKLEVRNLVGTALKPDNTLLNRLEYNPNLWKGFMVAGLFYESGYGLENKREYYYLEVAPGQGQYAWLDYNNNGIKELNEFEIALFNDQARYIRIYTPTNQYVKVLQNQFSLSVSLRPLVLLRKKQSALASFVKRWSTQTALRLDNKISDNAGKNNYNPFADVRDSLLLASNNNIRQSVFFNQSSAVFGADYTYIDNRSKQLLTNGLEGKRLESHEIRWRFNFFKDWSVNSSNIISNKLNNSQFFANRNYSIKAFESEQRLIFQPNTVFRVSSIYKYNEKRNTQGELRQEAFINTLACELKYNQTDKGSLSGRCDFIWIVYNAEENTSVAYEMLNGLSKGNNITWELNYQRNLNSSIQISINYNGRKTPGAAPVHLGGAQVRAFF